MAFYRGSRVSAAFSIHGGNYTVGCRKYWNPTGLKTGQQPATEQSVGKLLSKPTVKGSWIYSFFPSRNN
ncbi:hypothetical protein OUZ56_010053 [Daphnia magna]|uniref:Uncharacterized protein n=1 Tax=Daphnia magna TaxID=35525 RepID=A0ABR0AHM8_9CRUS|nr:hypothetical protein OUZ56_010053 [Daphnia magna]